MSQERLSDTNTEDYKALCDLNFLGSCWYGTGYEWTSMMREESLELSHKPLEAPKSRRDTNKIIVFSVLALLGLLSAATLTPAPVKSNIPQENITAISTK